MSIKFDNGYFQLFACCIAVKGARRSILCDLQRQDFLFIPNIFYDIFSGDRIISKEQLLAEYDEYENFDEHLMKLIDKLQEKEYGFYTNEPQNFPALNEDVRDPSRISNAIVDIGKELQLDLQKFAGELSENACQAIVLRFLENTSLDHLKQILRTFDHSTIRAVEVVLPYAGYLENIDAVESLSREFPRCRRVLIYNAPVSVMHELNYTTVIYTNFYITEHSGCGYISPHYFVINNAAYFEARKFNSCLNRKISVDKEGNVKNCPAMVENFGKYNALDSLETLLADPRFTRQWEIKKDDVSVCKDCEFRYICPDCRAFVKDKGDLYSKPLRCTYDPYEAVWH
jgi:SPASM domain peptide maturase of grasp-with-spasm system